MHDLTQHAQTSGPAMRPVHLPSRVLMFLLVTVLMAAACADDDAESDDGATAATEESAADGPTEQDAPTADDDGMTEPADGVGSAVDQTPADLTVGALVGRAGLTTGTWPAGVEYSGCAAEENLTVELVSLASAGDGINGLLSGSLDIVHMGSEGIISQANGEDIVGVATSNSFAPWFVMTSPDIASWDDIPGELRTVGVSGLQAVTAAAWRGFADAEGLVEGEDYELIVTGATAATFTALTEGQIDIGPFTAPFAFIAESEGFTNLGLHPPSMETPFVMQGGGAQVRADWAEENESALVRYLSCVVWFSEWLHDPANVADVVEFLQTGMDFADTDVAILERTVDLYTAPSPIEGAAGIGWPEDFHFYRPSVEAAIQQYLEVEAITEAIDPEDFIEERYLDAAIAYVEASG